MSMKYWLYPVLAVAVQGYAGDSMSPDGSSGMPAAHEKGHGQHSPAMQMEMAMPGLLGSYSMTREASGTSWQPEATPMGGYHFKADEWTLMMHGFANVIYDHQGGRRGNEDILSENMLMFMAQHPIGKGSFGFRSMLSFEPATIGDNGYPLLLQTGETPDGRTPLIDRQHPHDFLMELAAIFSYPITEESSAFLYAGMPGEPALGPPTFMHRFSGMDNPAAPISHHWLDSTHITFGVATVGYVYDKFKLEASIFTGREPDEERWDFDSPKFDSYALRLSYNPTKEWALQASYGALHSPELLEPDVDQDRITASAMYHKHWDHIDWQTTFAWGQNRNYPGPNLDAFLVESAVVIEKTHTIFGRFEHVQKDDLFGEDDPRHGKAYRVNAFSMGYIYDFPEIAHVHMGAGGVGTLYVLPESLDSAYGSDTPASFMLFARIKL